MSGFIQKSLHHIDAWQGTGYSSGSAYQGSIYARIAQDSLNNAASYMLDRIANIPQVLNMLRF